MALRQPIDMPALFDGAAAHWGDQKEALVAYRTAELDGPRLRWTIGDLATEVRHAATMFQTMDLGPSDRIALLLPTIPEIHPLLWGGMAVAGVALINPLLQAAHIGHLVDQADATVLCIPTEELSRELAERGHQIARARPGLKLVRVGPNGDYADGNALPISAPARSFGRAAEAPAALFHTGGTTGRPRIASLSLANLLSAVELLTPVLDYQPGDRFFSPLPLFHIAGAIVGGLAPILAGTTVVMPAPAGLRDPKVVDRCWRLLDREQVTMMVAVPTSLAALCNVPLGSADLSALDYVLTGTSPLPEETARRFTALTRKEVHTGYGMTESAGVIAYAPRREPARPVTVGKPLPGIDVRVEPLTDAHPIGRVLLRGPNVFAGYLGEAVRQPDVWLDTGDLGFIDPDGWLTLTGRSKDLIIRGGHNIDPGLIEETAARHPDVILAAAVGQIDDYAGEVPALYVELSSGCDETQTIAELTALLDREIAEPPARPRAIWAIASIPTTAVGKIYKPALRADAAHRRIAMLLEENCISVSQLQVSPDEAGRLVVRVELGPADRARSDEVRRLIERFPVTASLAGSEARETD